MRQKLLLAATLLLATAAVGVARAADPADNTSKHTKVKKLFELTSMQTRVDQIRASAFKRGDKSGRGFSGWVARRQIGDQHCLTFRLAAIK